jgi:hypothetical protein
MKSAMILSAVVLVSLPGSFCRGAEPDAAELDGYNVAKLLAKAERIVIAEIGPTWGDNVTLHVQETLKAPELDPKYVPPEAFKRAEALLGAAKGESAPPPTKVEPPRTVFVQVSKETRLPPQGNQALFFLWEKVPAAKEAPATPHYALSHPQNVYDPASALPQVRLGLSNPRSVADGRFLRDWDAKLAARAQERAANRALISGPSGEVVLGLKLTAVRPTISLRADNSFYVSAHIENTLNHDLQIYDGPAGGYGVVLRPKAGTPDSALVLRLHRGVEGVDRKTLDIIDATDFANIHHHGAIDKELFADAKLFPALAKLKGEYTLRVFYVSDRDGRDAEILDIPAWTGTLISPELTLVFPAKDTAKE